MTQVSFALAAFHFRSPHSMAAIFFGFHDFAFGRRIKTWPSATRIKLGLRPEQRLAAADALVCSRCARLFIFAAVGRLSSLLPRDKILIFRELLFPFGIGFFDFF